MEIPLPDYEIDILDSVIHTHTFGEYSDLEKALYDHVAQYKDRLIAEKKTNPEDFRSFQTETVQNIIHFLEHNEFIGVREGRVHFLTTRGEQLRKQGTLEKYIDWEREREATLLQDLHTIEEKGYLEKDQVAVHKEVKKLHEDLRRKPYNPYLPYYILIIIIIIILCWVGKTYFKAGQ